MKKRASRDFYIDRAASGFRELVTYFTTTRPRFQKAFQDEKGAFQPKKLEDALEFVKDFRKQTKAYKARNAQRYRFFQKVLNDTFCIPNHLIAKVLGVWRDENGNKHRITLKEIAPLVKDYCEKWTKHGHTFTKKGEKPSQSFCNKWRLVNKRQWYTLILMESDIFHDTSRVARIIRDFVKKERRIAEMKDFSTTNTQDNGIIAKNEEIKKEIGEMKVMTIQDTGIPHGDPPWVTATAPKAVQQTTQATTPQPKAETKKEAIGQTPNPAMKAKMISRIEKLAMAGIVSRSNYRTFIQTCYGEAPKPGIGKNIEESSNSLGTMHLMYKMVFSEWKQFCVPFGNRDLIEFQKDKYHSFYVEALRNEGILQRKVANA